MDEYIISNKIQQYNIVPLHSPQFQLQIVGRLVVSVTSGFSDLNAFETPMVNGHGHYPHLNLQSSLFRAISSPL